MDIVCSTRDDTFGSHSLVKLASKSPMDRAMLLDSALSHIQEMQAEIEELRAIVGQYQGQVDASKVASVTADVP